jgi:transcriptional regulator with XRE-family HTH domain
LSLDVVAGLAGISTPYLSLLERGQRGFNRRGLLDDLAAALGCSLADLTGQPYLPSRTCHPDRSIGWYPPQQRPTLTSMRRGSRWPAGNWASC